VKDLIARNAEEIRRLHGRIHDTVRHRAKSAEQKEQWERACAEFHARYDQLAFPGGYSTALDRIRAGDVQAIEAGLCFLELRPYFFRSGYMFKALLPKVKRAPLSTSQAARLGSVVEAYERWQAGKRHGKTARMSAYGAGDR
jgi:hypothetical protein